jgi:transposase InsO family protein
LVNRIEDIISQALQYAVENTDKAYFMSVDNRIDCINSTFQQKCKEMGIFIHRIQVKKPQENRKTERFYRRLEKVIQSYDDLDEFIQDYNFKLIHSGLKNQFQNCNKTQYEVWRVFL